jgi:DNA-binding PadR family transcriptional regulator
MDAFIQQHRQDVIGVLSGFDRMRFRGTLRAISYGSGVDRFLGTVGVRYKQYKEFVLGLSERIVAHAKQVAQAAGRPFEYMARRNDDKQARAQALAERDGIREGLVCVLRSLESCPSFRICRDGKGGFSFRCGQRQCLYLYYYYLDREFGLMHVRVCSWLPFGIQVCLNGREYLARRMRRAGIGYEQRDNCFTRIDDLPRAQAMMQDLDKRKWERFLNTLARRVNPLLGKDSGLNLPPYYWSLSESEYATDVMFGDAPALAKLYPALVDHALRRFDSKEVLRFLGRRTNCRFNGEVASSYLERSEGVRVKHWLQENSIKMYDKQGSVLRIETTINNARRFLCLRMTVRKGVRGLRWIPMRHAVADLDRRVEISRAANERYLEALAMVTVPSVAHALLDAVSHPVTKDKRPYRPLRPVSLSEAAVFAAVLKGQFLLKGFTNRDVREQIESGPSKDPQERRRASGRTTRWLRLLRAHGLIGKVSGTRYYRVTPKGQQIMTAALKLRAADVAKLAA